MIGHWEVRASEVVRLGIWKAFSPFGLCWFVVSGKIEDGRRKQGVCGLDRFEMRIFLEAVLRWVEDVWVLLWLSGVVLVLRERNECLSGSSLVLLGFSLHPVVAMSFS